MIKKTLKFMLCALLLSAVGSAFAAGEEVTPEETSEVTLKNGSGISWEKFVANLNNPANIKGEADSIALHDARVAYLGEDYPTVKTGGARGDSISKEATYTSYKTRYENAEKALSSNQTYLTQLNSQLGQMNSQMTALNTQYNRLGNSTVTQTKTWLQNIVTAANKYESAYDDYVEIGEKSTLKLYYAKLSTRIYISFEDPNDAQMVPNNTLVWTGATPEDFQKDIVNDAAVSIKNVYVYYGKTDGVYNYELDGVTNGCEKTSFTEGTAKSSIVSICVSLVKSHKDQSAFTETVDPNADAKKKLEDQMDELQEKIDEINNSITTTNKSINDYTQIIAPATESLQDQYLSAYTTAQSNYNTAVTEANLKREAFRSAITAYATAQKEAAANALGNYDEVILNADITATTSFINAYSGRINANNHVITINIPNNAALFSNFRNGHLENAIINGVFATGGEYFNVAAWRGANGIYYDENGNNGGTVTNIGKLAFDNRDLKFFSANISDKELVSWSEDNQVYDITLYQPNATTQFYTNISGSTFVNNPISGVSKNAFYVSKTNDFGNIANVIVDKTCANVVITDKESFYCPFDITATEVTLNRTLNKGFNTVCLPFEMTYTNMGLGANDLLCTYDKETTDKFWFSKTTEVAANTPALIYLETGNDGSTSLSGVTIKQTESQLVNFEGSTDDKSQACGLFKNTTAESIRGGSQAIKVYGLQGGSSVTNPDDPSGAKFNPAGNATFGAFRMVIVSELAAEQAEQGQPLRARGIGVVDEKGIEINFGDLSVVEIIDMESSSLTVTPGHGEIIITTDANYGMQTVYTMDGKAVAKVNVVEGTNTVNVPSGIYVVMGQKVMVD